MCRCEVTLASDGGIMMMMSEKNQRLSNGEGTI